MAQKEASSRSMVHALVASNIVHSSEEVQASTLIQKVVRGHQLRTAVVLYTSATKIQSAWRAYTCRFNYKAYSSARTIQKMWRAYVPRVCYKTYVAARRIQTLWRCKNLHKAYRYYRSALEIQRRYRGMRARQNVLVLRGEVLAATLIQSAWRGFVCYTDYIFTSWQAFTLRNFV